MTERTEAESVASLAREVNPSINLLPHLLLTHENFNLKDIENQMPARHRPRGVFKTPTIADFVDFIESNGKDAPVFMDHERMSAIAVLNMGTATPGEQGHCDYRAALTLESTVAWRKLNEIAENKKFDQRGFATFLEDWSDLLIAMSPTQEPIDPRDAIHAVRNMVVDASASSSSTVANTSESRSILEKVEAKSKEGKLPAYFALKDSCYVGLTERQVLVRLVVNTNDGKPVFHIQIVKLELIQDALTNEFKQIIKDKLPENPVRIGTFTA